MQRWSEQSGTGYSRISLRYNRLKICRDGFCLWQLCSCMTCSKAWDN